MNLHERLSETELAVFLFHGVVESNNSTVRNYTKKHLLASDFREILTKLKLCGTALSMEKVSSHLRKKSPFPPRSFAITFDDGFRNNLTVAAPILSDLKLPAMLYITTRFIEENVMSWIDQIEYCLDRVASTKVTLPWEQKGRAIETAENKIDLLKEVRRYVKSHAEFDVEKFISQFCLSLGQPKISSSDDPLDAKLTWDQVRQWLSIPGLSIGGHGHTHAILSFLSKHALHKEIETSLSLVQEKLGVRSKHYSYPEGLAHCYSPEVIAVLKEHGIVCCPTAEDGLNDMLSDPFLLKRIAVT